MDLESAPVEGLSSILFEDGSLEAVLDIVVRLASDLVRPATGVGITLVEDGRVTTAAHTEDFVRTVDTDQYETQEGPCLQAILDTAVIRSPDLQIEERWPAFCVRALRHGVRSVLSLPLSVRNGAIGALNIYSDRTNVFGEHEQATAQAFADHAAVVLANAEALANASQLSENLRAALETREVIGQAKGILMQREGCTADTAFDILRRESQSKNIKLREVARRLVESMGAP